MIILVVSLGGQYNHLIARRVREANAKPLYLPLERAINKLNEVDGIISGGGPHRLPQDLDKLKMLGEIINHAYNNDKPFLGICLSHQYLALHYGGLLGESSKPEFGGVELDVFYKEGVLEGFPDKTIVWESHNDEVKSVPKNFRNLARTSSCEIQVLAHNKKPLYSLQFHPEVKHSIHGELVFKNFIGLVKE